MDYAHWADEFAKKEAKIGATLRIRLPQDRPGMVRVEYDTAVDGWRRSWHVASKLSADISERVWNMLAQDGANDGILTIPCQSGLTEASELLAVASAIESTLDRKSAPTEVAAVAERLMAGNRDLRERIAALEIQNAELIRQSMRNMLAVDMPFVSAAEAEPLPQSESDRIFWDALRMAAQT